MYNTDLVALTHSAIPGWDRQKETGLTARVAKKLATHAYLTVWCASSRAGAGRELSKFPNVQTTYTGVRDIDLAFGPRYGEEPAIMIQYKYDKGPTRIGKDHPKEYCKTSPFLDALGDLVYVAVDLLRLGGERECHVVSVVHEESLCRHGWGKVCSATQEAVWTFECEPNAVREIRNRLDFVCCDERTIKPNTVATLCRIMGTKFQRPGYGLFARAGKLRIRFTSRAEKAGDLWVVDWRVIDVTLEGAEDAASLVTWLP